MKFDSVRSVDVNKVNDDVNRDSFNLALIKKMSKNHSEEESKNEEYPYEAKDYTYEREKNKDEDNFVKVKSKDIKIDLLEDNKEKKD